MSNSLLLLGQSLALELILESQAMEMRTQYPWVHHSLGLPVRSQNISLVSHSLVATPRSRSLRLVQFFLVPCLGVAEAAYFLAVMLQVHFVVAPSILEFRHV